MATTRTAALEDVRVQPRLPNLLVTSFRPACRTVISWSLAGGVVAGGLLPVAATLGDPRSAGSIPAFTTVLFLMGAAAGLTHGGLLGYLARDEARGRREALISLLLSLVWVAPGLVVAWAATMWISLTGAAVGDARPAWVAVGALLGWILGAAMCAWALREGWLALGRAFARWPGYRVSSLVAAVVFAVLVVVFHQWRPEIWFTDVRVTGLGSVLLALAATVWIALPVALAALRLRDRMKARRT